MKISDSIDIRADIDKTFKAFSDLSRSEKVIDGIKKIEILEGPALMQVGTKWRETREMFGKEASEVMWVTELKENKSYKVEASSRGTEYTTTYNFEQTGNNTRVSCVFEAVPKSISAKIMNLAGFLFRSATKKALRKDLEDLKQAIEKS